MNNNLCLRGRIVVLLVPLAIAASLPLEVGAAVTTEKVELVTGVPFSPGSTNPERAQFGSSSNFSEDSRYLVYSATAASVVPGVRDTNGESDVFLADLATGQRFLVSHAAGQPNRAAGGPSNRALVSGDGRYIAFTSAAPDLLPGVTSGTHAYLRDRQTGNLTLISHAVGGGAANDSSFVTAFAKDGRYLAIVSKATNLVSGVVDTNAANDLFLWDAVTDTFQLVTRQAANPLITSASTETAPGASFMALSADGRYLAYTSGATELDANDPTNDADVYLFDRVAGTNTLLSRDMTSGSTASSDVLAASPDGRFVLFDSQVPAGTLIPGIVDRTSATPIFSSTTGNQPPSS